MKNLTKKDVYKYIKSGELTRPFLDDNFVKDKVNTDYRYRIENFNNGNILESLYLWIHKNIEKSDAEFKIKYKFNRTAKEIWESGKSTGCTDYALIFATFARQLGISTTIFCTAEKNWLIKNINNEDFSIRSGHAFCECYYEGKWVLVDPTCKEIIEEYDANIITLPYSIGGKGCNTYIPYYRGCDLGRKMTAKEHSDFEDNCINKMLC